MSWPSYISRFKTIFFRAPIVTAIVIGLIFWFLDAANEVYLEQTKTLQAALFQPSIGDFTLRVAVLAASLLFTWSLANVVHARAVIKQSEERVRLLLGSTAEGIFGVDRDGKCIFANASCAELLGYSSPDELVGTIIHPLIHHTKLDGSPYPAEECPAIRSLSNGQPTHTADDAFWKKDGTRIRVEYWSRPIHQGGRFVGTVNSFTDITERKRAEAHAAFLSEMSVILSNDIDLDARLASLTQLAVPRLADCCTTLLLGEAGRLRVVGVAATEPRKKEVLSALAKEYPPDFRNWKANPFLKVVESRSPFFMERVTPQIRQEIARDAGHAKLLSELGTQSWIIVPLVARGRVLGLLSLIRFTNRFFDRKDLELAEEVARRSAVALDNASLYGQLREALATRDDFIAVASHELKTPLTALQLQLQLVHRLISEMRKRTTNGADLSILESRIQELAEGGVDQVATLSALIHQLLDLTRIRSGKIELSLAEIDLAHEIREVVAGFTHQILQSGIQLQVDVPDGILGRWDRTRIRQIVSNLISNALKYGNGRPIYIAASVKGDAVEIEIKDQGSGISKELQERVFERFERAGAPRTISGLGLGLYITRQLVLAHGGRVWVESEPGKGSRFFVKLPLERAEKMTPPPREREVS